MKYAHSLLVLCFTSIAGTAAANGNCQSASLQLFGKTDHGPQNQNRNYNEKNDGVGLKIYKSEKILWACTYLEADYIRNSVRGRTSYVSVGAEWKYKNENNPLALVAGLNIGHMDYEVPGKGHVRRWLPLPFIAIDAYDGYRINFTPLPGKVKMFYVSIPLNFF